MDNVEIKRTEKNTKTRYNHKNRDILLIISNVTIIAAAIVAYQTFEFNGHIPIFLGAIITIILIVISVILNILNLLFDE